MPKELKTAAELKELIEAELAVRGLGDPTIQIRRDDDPNSGANWKCVHVQDRGENLPTWEALKEICAPLLVKYDVIAPI
jgi:hypothetical protein